MNYVEYGRENNDVIILLHGGGFIHVLSDMYHGEFSINHANDYVRKILEIVKQR